MPALWMRLQFQLRDARTSDVDFRALLETMPQDGAAPRGFPLYPPVAARDYAGGPVVGGEVIECPDGGHHDVTVARECAA